MKLSQFIYHKLKILDKFIESLSIGLLVLFIMSMLVLTICSILFRNLQITAFWIDPLIRHIVFASAFLGGVLAVGSEQHIGIDILSKFFEQTHNQKASIIVKQIIYLCCIFTLGLLIKSSIRFIEYGFEYEKVVFWGIHRAYLFAIIPVGLGLMLYRFFFLFINNIYNAKLK